MVKVKFRNTASGPAGCFMAGAVYELESLEKVAKYIKAGYAFVVDQPEAKTDAVIAEAEVEKAVGKKSKK
jgi:hypothetical protein